MNPQAKADSTLEVEGTKLTADTEALEVQEEASPPVVEKLTDYSNSDYYINRELSNLQFNLRVLEQAANEEHPLLERLRYLLIFSSNMDEFFEIRVAGLKQQIDFSREQVGLDGMQPQQVLNEISRITHESVARQYEMLQEQLLPALQEQNIRILRRSEWSEEQVQWVSDYFYSEVMPVISPIGLDPAHPFPRLANKNLNFIVSLEGKDAFGRETGMAIIPAPRSLPRVIRFPPELSGEGICFTLLSAMIHQHAEDLFPGMTIKGCYQFRLTRNSDLILDDEVEDLATALQGELQSRRWGKAVRLEVADNCTPELANFLLKEFGLTQDELYEVNGPVNLARLMDLCNLPNLPELQYQPFTPSFPKGLMPKENLFDAITSNDILLLHPFQSFTPVVDLLRQSAKDPHVLAIKQTLYRTGAQSEIVDALVDAARNGKEVIVVIELRARFDEEENLTLARRLQEAGAIVVYGVVGYKTHAKLMMVVRREDGKIVRYAHLGTGNYHAGNARLYTDYSLLTRDKDLTNDVSKIFQQLTGMGKAVRVKKLLHAPFTLKKGLLDHIQQEIQHVEAGGKGHIIVKCNSLTEAKVIKELYKASQAGVKIDLIIRGICCLRPGVPGLSDNIRVRSIVGRFLEHSRTFYFANNGEPRVYASSADWMVRNLDHRIETCYPIEHPKLAQRVKKELDAYLQDNCMSWQLQSDGSYRQNQPRANQPRRDAQMQLLIKLT
ncbi:polyphosphate kinase 1 [Aestuariirhabdus litorea]|uniref:Polyphosphate kinase n=1 Tax=Aestuariirhabdus litorea TaxID=2528527 RepID=A0A3P3VM76_9GAMM|nr:polyphosphate kinase 1 [Aestuariirhabdus litorea]RRJ82978.1 polyphosphate kinase 1 [Aestuariirhabdus litorea]RWW93138.1 polyphosphate kinase 1 [Endozoicomonadaceae bacterium GTF-13]